MTVTINGSGAIVGSDRASSGSNSDLTSLNSITSLNTGQLAGMRNVIINGACNVQQRGSVIITQGVNAYGGPDRYYASMSGTAGQFTQAASTITFGGQVKDSVRQTVNTGTTAFTTTNYWYGITQFIEGLNAYYLKDKPFVVSFIFNTNVTGTYSVAVRDVGTTPFSSYVSTFSAVANVPIKVSIAVPVMPSGASIPRTNATGLKVIVGFLNQATYQTSTLNSWVTTDSYTASTQTIWAATAGNFIELTELQLEVGTVATPFEQRLYPVEFALCQRYYEKANFSWVGYQSAGSGFGSAQPFAVVKRVVPTLVTSGTSTTNVTSAGITVLGTDAITQTGFASSTGVVLYTGIYTASAEL